MSASASPSRVIIKSRIKTRNIVIARSVWRRSNPMKISYSFVYLMTNKLHTVIYFGVTSNLVNRVYAHKNKLVEGFSKKYNLTKLVYYEVFEDIVEAIRREKKLKGGARMKKIELIEKNNPKYNDLYPDITLWMRLLLPTMSGSQ